MKFAYADPPYIGCARRFYKNQPDYAGEVDHKELLDRLHNDYPDGWALSASMTSLWDIIPVIPKERKCRIAAWCKPFGQMGALGWPQYCWEPVIFCGGRRRPRTGGSIADFIISNGFYAVIGHRGASRNTARRVNFPGAKPDEFCYWIFELLNMKPGDELADLFPGTGRVARAWETYQKADMSLFLTNAENHDKTS